MAIILGIDALEYECVCEFNCRNLMQLSFGKTDISEFSEPRTIVLWSSFLAGKNLEKEVLALGNEKMWQFKLELKETFLAKFRNRKVVDVPGFAFNEKQHQLERQLLKKFFNQEITVEQFDLPVLRYHKKIKEQFLADLQKDFDLIFYYFNAADVIGHVSFGLKSKMSLIYQDLDEIAAQAAATGQKMLIVSDHGMQPVGRFGDHRREYGFWSANFDAKLRNPKITSFRALVEKEML